MLYGLWVHGDNELFWGADPTSCMRGACFVVRNNWNVTEDEMTLHCVTAVVGFRRSAY